MATIQPGSGQLKKAIQWLSEKRKEDPNADPVRLADKAAFRFDLSPKDSEFILRFVKDDHNQDPA